MEVTPFDPNITPPEDGNIQPKDSDLPLKQDDPIASLAKEKLASFSSHEAALDEDFAHKFETMFVEKDPTSPFFATDLVVFKDAYKGRLPLNGIKESDFLAAQEYYQRFLAEETKLQVHPSSEEPDFEKQVEEAVIMLLTRRIGREILFQLENLQNVSSVPISYSELAYEAGGSVHINFESANSLTLNSEGDREITTYPGFIALGHELIHVLHEYNPKSSTDMTGESPTASLTSDKKPEAQFDNLEEQLTIIGLSAPLKFNFNYDARNEELPLEEWIEGWQEVSQSNYDELNENNLRAAFFLPPRPDHRAIQDLPDNFRDLDSEEFKEYFYDLILNNVVPQLKELMTYSIDWSKPLMKGKTPLEIAVSTGNLKVAQLFVTHGADPQMKNSLNQNLCKEAISNGHVGMVKWLVDQGVEINLPDHQGNTSLHFALKNQSLDLKDYQTLLKLGASPFIKNAKGKTAFHLAVSESSEMAGSTVALESFIAILPEQAKRQLLLDIAEDRIQTSNKSEQMAILMRSLNGPLGTDAKGTPIENIWLLEILDSFSDYHFNSTANRELFHQFFAIGDDFSWAKQHGRGICHLAIKLKDPELLQKQIELGANINQQDDQGNTPFHLLAMSSFFDEKSYQILVSKGADINIKNNPSINAGQAPYDVSFSLVTAVMASEKGLQIFKKLISHPDVPELVKQKFLDKTITSLIPRKVRAQLIEILLEALKDPQSKDSKGVTFIDSLIQITVDEYDDDVWELLTTIATKLGISFDPTIRSW